MALGSSYTIGGSWSKSLQLKPLQRCYNENSGRSASPCFMRRYYSIMYTQSLHAINGLVAGDEWETNFVDTPRKAYIWLLLLLIIIIIINNNNNVLFNVAELRPTLAFNKVWKLYRKIITILLYKSYIKSVVYTVNMTDWKLI